VTTKPIQNKKALPAELLRLHTVNYGKIKTAKVAKFEDKNFKAIKFCAVI
jgi:hypothetical protein